MVTPLEAIDEDAKPIQADRFIEDQSSKPGWSLINYLDALISRPVDRSRVFLFVLTTDDSAEKRQANMSPAFATKWQECGAHALQGLKDVKPSNPISNRHIFLILVYEFTKSPNDVAQMVLPQVGHRIDNFLKAAGLSELMVK